MLLVEDPVAPLGPFGRGAAPAGTTDMAGFFTECTRLFPDEAFEYHVATEPAVTTSLETVEASPAWSEYRG